MKTATVWWCLENLLSPHQIINLTETLGYDGIEMAPETEWSRIAHAGLAIVSHRGHGSLEDGLNVSANHDRIERELLANIELAHTWKVPVLICFSGNRRGMTDEQGAENTAAGLLRVARAAEEAGVVLALELLNSKIDHRDYQCDRTSWGVQVIENVHSPSVKLLYDIYHMQIMEGDVIRTIQGNHQHFGHYHLAGNPGRNEPDNRQEINYPPIAEVIESTGFSGYLGMEFLPSIDPSDALRVARELVR
ncbi:TIM barrel protein [soil metagenome]